MAEGAAVGEAVTPLDCGWTWPQVGVFAAVLVSGAGLLLGALALLLHAARAEPP